MAEVNWMLRPIIVWIYAILSLVDTVLCELCQYKAHSYNTGYSYGYAIRYRSCTHGCCGNTAYTYCCSGVSGQDWRTIGIGIGCTVAGLILLGVVICVCCALRGRQCSKNSSACRRGRERSGRCTSDQRSRESTDIHCLATISEAQRDPVTRALPAYTPGRYVNEAYINDNIDIPPSYEEAISGDTQVPHRTDTIVL